MQSRTAVKIVKPFPVQSNATKLGFPEEIILNDALSRFSTSLRMIDNREIAEGYYTRVKQYLSDFEKLWGLGDKH